LLDLWRESFGSPPPKYLSQAFLQKALVFEIQRRQLGDVSKNTVRALEAVAGGRAPSRASSLKPGSHLIREWNGRSYMVEVTEGGFRMDGKCYRSLTSIASQITGVHWSGPKFFGIR
jgi:hypothetical protein